MISKSLLPKMLLPAILFTTLLVLDHLLTQSSYNQLGMNLILDNKFLDSYDPIERFQPPEKVYHFVHHTHTDSGWIETMDTYSKLFVDSIISNTSKYLAENPDSPVAKFTYTNVDYPWDFKKRFPALWPRFVENIKSGRMETLNDGIVMPDQALPYFDDLINVYEYGREFALKEFGKMTQIGWHVDTFGQSASMVSILADMGYDFQGVNRIFLPTREKLELTGNFIINWKQLYPDQDLMTYILPFHYGPLVYDTYKMRYQDGHFNMLDPSYEALHMTKKFYVWIHGTGEMVNWNNVAVMIGDDFMWPDAEYNYNFYQKRYIELKSNQKSIFKGTYKVSNVKEVFTEIRKEQIQIDDYKGDFFPLVSYNDADGMVAWTGFFYVKPAFKYRIKEISMMVRGLTNILGYIKLLGLSTSELDLKTLQDARFYTGIMMHHDAITGTCTNNVVEDYFRMIEEADRLVNIVAQSALQNYTGNNVRVLSHLVIPISESGLEENFVVMNQETAGQKVVRVNVPKSIFDNFVISFGNGTSRTVCSLFDCEISVHRYFKPFEIILLSTHVNSSQVRKLNISSTARDDIFTCNSNSIKVGKLSVSLGYYSTDISTTLDRVVYQLGLYVLKTFYNRPVMAKLRNCSWHPNTDGTYTVSAVADNPVPQTLSIVVSRSASEGKSEYQIDEVLVGTSEIRIIEDVELLQSQ